MDYREKAPTPDDLLQMHNSCTAALAEYIKEAQKTCELLGQLGAFPVSLEKRQVILKQRQMEHAAHEQYQQSRERLFTAAKWHE